MIMVLFLLIITILVLLNLLTTQHSTNVSKLEKKFNTNFHDYYYFKCHIEELRMSTILNQTRREIDEGYVIIYDNYIEILKESVFFKRNMGSRKMYFKNITSINRNKRGLIHLSDAVMINTKSSERAIEFKYVKEEDFNMLVKTFDKYNDQERTGSVISGSDELMKYAKLYREGLLTLEEFENKKKELL